MSTEMKYTPTRALNLTANTESEIWLGNHLDYIDNGKEVSKVIVGGEKRLVLSSLLRIARLYTAQHEPRVNLGHDCVTFAYSCDSGDMYEASLAARKGGNIILPQTINRVTDDLTKAPLTTPGEVVYTTSSPIHQALDVDVASGLHFMVHATADSKEPLYLSKFGSIGSIILTDFQQSLQLYPAQTRAVAADFEARC